MADGDRDDGRASRALRVTHALGPLGSRGALRSQRGNLVMISGECRVEPVGLTTGHQLALDGLRLRLDLRIVPGTAEDGSAAAIWRVEDGRIRTLRLGVPEVYRRAAMLTGVGVLVLALAVWFAGSRTPSDGQVAPSPASPVITTTVTPAIEAAAGAASVAPVPAVAVPPGVAPQPPPAVAFPTAPTPPPAPAAPEAARAEAPAAPASEPEGPAAAAPALAARPRPAVVRAPAGDNLDLFSDPK
jgi:hypothetical protein